MVLARDGQVISSRGRAIIAVSAVFSVLAIVSVALRFIVKIKQKSGVFLDDWLIIAALIVTLGVTINNIVAATMAGMGDDEYYRTDAEAPGFPYPRELLPQGQVMFALQILHTCAMPLIKASILAFYWRVFQQKRRFKSAVYIISIYVFCWWISILFATIFQCSPVSDNWGTVPSQLTGCLPSIPIMYEIAAITNMLSDVAILALPFPIVCNLQMLSKHKTIVLAIFMTGSIVIVAGIGRTVSYFSYRNLADYNFSSDYYALIIWTSLEPTLGVVGACLPTIRPLFKGMSPESIINSIRSFISLHSTRGSKTQLASPGQTQANGGTYRKGSDSIKGFVRLEDDASVENSQDVGTGATGNRHKREDRKAGLGNRTVVSIELDERVRVENVDLEDGRIRAQTTYGVLADRKT